MKKFDDDLNVAVITTKAVFRKGEPILYVFHHEDDGAWEFIGGGISNEEDYLVISLEEMIEHDPSILEVADLPYGGEAYRETKLSPWKYRGI